MFSYGIFKRYMRASGTYNRLVEEIIGNKERRGYMVELKALYSKIDEGENVIIHRNDGENIFCGKFDDFVSIHRVLQREENSKVKKIKTKKVKKFKLFRRTFLEIELE